MTAGTRRGLTEAAKQRAQTNQLFQPLDQQTPVAIEAVLLGQPLAAAQQVPGQGRHAVIQAGLWRQVRHGQTQAVTGRVEQPITPFGLADIARHQCQVSRQFGCQLQQRIRLTLTQFKFQLADFLFAFTGNHLAQIQRRLDHHLGLATAPGDFRLLTDKIGGEDRHQLLLVQLGQGRRPTTVVELLQVQLGLAQVPVPLVALGQTGDTLPTGFQGLNNLLAITAQT